MDWSRLVSLLVVAAMILIFGWMLPLLIKIAMLALLLAFSWQIGNIIANAIDKMCNKD